MYRGVGVVGAAVVVVVDVGAVVVVGVVGGVRARPYQLERVDPGPEVGVLQIRVDCSDP